MVAAERKLLRVGASPGAAASSRATLVLVEPVGGAMPKVKITRLAHSLGHLQDSNGDFQSNLWVDLKIMSQPCEFQVPLGGLFAWQLCNLREARAIMLVTTGLGAAQYAIIPVAPFYTSRSLGPVRRTQAPTSRSSRWRHSSPTC